jgi:predicted acyltransferase
MTERLVALDAFRGMTIAFMVLVNTPGTGQAVYAPLRHARWHGWTPTDVVFPSFVWITGLAMTLSLGRRLAQGADRTQLLLQAARRAAILFALGLFLYSFPVPDLETFRVLGVLQRIAICYFVSAAIYLYTGVRGQIGFAVFFLLLYWLLMAFAPVPGIGAGHLERGQNFSNYVDSIVLGRHNYENTKTWDPEGVVSTLPAIASCLLGILAGHIVARRDTLAVRTTWLFFIGFALICLAQMLNPFLPINKEIWTSTFALFMAGLDFVMLAAVLWIADGLGYTRPFRPFVILGMNAIAIYMASELIEISLWKLPMGGASAREWIYQTFFAPLASPHNASLLYALCFVGLMFAIAWGMYRKRWFVRI